MSIRWTSGVAIGISEIDRDHQAFYGAVASLLDAMGSGTGKAELGRLLGFVQGYVSSHFELEERAMEESDYPELGPHRREHQQFAHEFSRLQRELEATGPTTALVIEANERAVQWLRTHIAGADRRFGAFWRERSRPGAPKRPSQPTERSAQGTPPGWSPRRTGKRVAGQ